MTDIADFFPRLYLHPLENMLRRSVAESWTTVADGSERVLAKLLKGWNQNVSHGIPVGPAATRLLAEIAITDIDRALISEGIQYVRFSDDFRIFCDSEKAAYLALALLADLLLSNHGLTLQANKTHVMPVDRFLDRHSTPEVQAGLENLSERVTSVLADLGLTPYDVVINAKLSNEEMVRVQELSLIDLLRTGDGRSDT